MDIHLYSLVQRCSYMQFFFDLFPIEYDSLITKTDFTSLWRGWKIHFWYASEDLFFANFMLPKPSRIYKIHNINFYKREWPPPPFISFIKKQENWYLVASLSRTWEWRNIEGPVEWFNWLPGCSPGQRQHRCAEWENLAVPKLARTQKYWHLQ